MGADRNVVVLSIADAKRPSRHLVLGGALTPGQTIVVQVGDSTGCCGWGYCNAVWRQVACLGGARLLYQAGDEGRARLV